MVDVDQDGIKSSSGCARIKTFHRSRQHKKIAEHETAAWIGRQRRSERQKALLVPVNDCIDRLNNNERLDGLMLKHCLCSVA